MLHEVLRIFKIITVTTLAFGVFCFRHRFLANADILPSASGRTAKHASVADPVGGHFGKDQAM